MYILWVFSSKNICFLIIILVNILRCTLSIYGNLMLFSFNDNNDVLKFFRSFISLLPLTNAMHQFTLRMNSACTHCHFFKSLPFHYTFSGLDWNGKNFNFNFNFNLQFHQFIFLEKKIFEKMFWFGFSFNLKTNFLYQKNAFCHLTGHSILICFQLSSFKIIC